MRTPGNNPFLPGSDQVPQVWAGRRLDIADFREVLRPRRAGGLYERGRAVLGEFGIGKSALVNRIAEVATAAGDWVPARVRVPIDADVFGLVAESLTTFVQARGPGDAVGRAADGLLSRISEFSLPVLGGGVKLRDQARSANAYRALLDVIVEIASLARAEDRVLLLRIDEVQNITDVAAMSQLMIVLGDALEATVPRTDVTGTVRQDALPLAVYLSGLPDFMDLAADAGATFSRRFRTTELEPLRGTDMRESLRPFTTDGWEILGDDGPARVFMADGVVEDLVDRSVGDPFLFQLAGEVAWNAGSGSIILREEGTRGWLGAQREVRGYVEARLRGVTDLQMQVLEAAAALDAEGRTGAALARSLGRRSSSELASTIRSLDVEHRLIRRRAGRIAFRSSAVEAFLGREWPAEP